MKKNFTILLVVSLISSTIASQPPYDSFAPESTRPMLDYSLSSAEATAIERTFRQNNAVDFHWDSFSLLADSGTLVHDLPISFALLPHGEEHRMPSYMVNVTGENVGAYRLLPNGVHFSEPATIALPYDEFLLPMGYKPKDIKTYYFDEELAQWKELQRINVDTAQHVILSYTTHFTEFANAVIKLPEVPEMKAFVPTAMQDLPDVNPLQGIPMIAPPTANNRGTAELTYPIELPAGRCGMQPNIDLHYSSAGGNDILGVGWSIPQPAITIDTRWGVPRFEPLIETEAYLLNGEQIVLHDENDEPIPLPHQAGASGFPLRKYGLVQYYARNTKNQDRIVRRGTELKDLHWEVADRNGTTSYYGYDPISHVINENAVVRAKNDAIAYWALTATVDMFGNYVHYIYHKDNNEVYLDRIEYTGNLRNNTSPFFKIWINYETNTRPDITSNGRLGVLQKKNYRLDCFTISSGTKFLSQYRMTYECTLGTLNKSRLSSVTKYERPDCVTCCATNNPEGNENGWQELSSFFHRLDPVPPGPVEQVIDRGMTQQEADSISEKLDSGIAHPAEGIVTTFQYQNARPVNNLFTSNPSRTSQIPISFSRSSNQSWSVGGTATVGFGENPIFTSGTIGANYNYNKGQGSVVSMMMDLNGDGLPDMVFLEDTLVYFCKQNPNGSFASAARVYGINSLSREVSETHSFGVQTEFVANFSYNPALCTTYTDIFFSDVNGDGLPDLVTPDGIKYNLLNANGHPTFTPMDASAELDVNNTRCGTVVRDGGIDARLECENRWVRDTSMLWHGRLIAEPGRHYDIPIRVDKNPKRPTFDLANTIPSSEGREVDFYNIFQVVPMEENDYQDISANPGTPTTFGDTSSVTYSVNINPLWLTPDYSTQQVGDSLIVYHLETICKDSSTLPDVDIVRVWVAPRAGDIKLTSRIHLKQDTTFSRRMSRRVDGVKYIIQHNASIQDSGRIEAIRTDTICTVYNSIPVQAHDVFFFRLSANKDRRFDDTEWEQTVEYLTGNADVYQSAEDYVCTGNNVFVAPCSGTAVVGYLYEDSQNAPVTISVIKNHTTIPISQPHSLNAHDTIFFRATYSGVEPQWSKVHIRPYVKFLVNTTDPAFQNINDTLRYYPDIQIDYSSIIPDKSNSLRKRYGLLHKGWGVFAYNNKDHDEIIDTLTLVNADSAAVAKVRTDSATLYTQFSSIDTATIRIQVQGGELGSTAEGFINIINDYNPLENDSKWIAMHADSRTETWVAYGNLGSIGQKLHSTSAHFDSTQVKGGPDVEYDSAIPVPTTRTGEVKTLRKENFSVQHCLSAGVGMMSENFSFGTYEVKMDYMDMNGDGFPDCISTSSTQYSTPWGGIGTLDTIKYDIGNNKTTSVGVGFSGSKNAWEKVTANGQRLNLYNTSMGGSLGGSSTENHGEFTRMDMNADGLPDLVKKDSVWYNLGYSFAPGMPLNLGFINNGYSQTASASASVGVGVTLLDHIAHAEDLLSSSQSIGDILGNLTDYSLFQFSLSGGVSTSVANNQSTSRLIDIDGDGYPDMLNCVGNSFGVRLLKNGYFQTPIPMNFAHTLTSTTGNMGINIGLTAGFTVGVFPIKLCFGVQTAPWSAAMTQSQSELMDMNGDGFVDYVQEDATNNATTLSVFYNQNGLLPVNLLTSVTNPTGQVIELAYEQSTPSVEQRGRTWLLSSVKDSIMATDGSRKHMYAFSYNEPYHDNFERTDFGYASVITIDNQEKILEETFSNDNFISKGEKLSDLLKDISGNPFIGHSHQIGYVDLSNQNIPNPLCGDASIHVAYDYYQTDYYEGNNTSSITTRYKLDYDRFFNVVERTDFGDITISADDWVQSITYLTPGNNQWSYNLISLPISEIVEFGSSILRQSATYYNAFGRHETIIFKNGNALNTSGSFFGYDIFGNIVEMAFPEDDIGSGNRAWYKFVYDDITYSLPAMIFNHFLEQQYMFYHDWYRLPTAVIDPSGNAIQYEYDESGRLTKVISPIETLLHGTEPYTVRYCYRIPGHEYISDAGADRPYVLKLGLSKGICNVDGAIYDARGHEIQRKHLTKVNDTIRWVADGIKKFDAFYRPIKVSLPFVSRIKVGVWDTIPTRTDSMIFSYDVMDRIIAKRNFDSTSRLFTYTFGQDAHNTLRLKTIVRDENHLSSSVLKSPQDWIIQTNTPDNHITFYEYNPIGARIKVTDADGYQTTYQYDNWGNCIERNHPDAGITRWTYSPAGNLLSMQSNKHINNSHSVTYNYNHGRLIGISYPAYPENNISYEYDFAGRIRKRTDGTGYESYTYDELGNIASSFRHTVIPSETYAYNFRTFYDYDSFGRIKKITYPDGDDVLYKYHGTGELESVTHHPESDYGDTLVSRLRYNEFGQRIHQKHGNGIVSDFTYSPQRQWLISKVTRGPGNNLQNLSYAYDSVGNILIVNQCESDCAGLGGYYVNEYTYDNQNRLIRSMGTSNYPFNYNFSMSYSPSGRLGHNSCGANIVNKKLRYGYDSDGLTHQPRVVYDSIAQTSFQLFWDANGNLAQIQNCALGNARHHFWNEENQLQAAIGPQSAGIYGYDGDGNRVWKLTGLCWNDGINRDGPPIIQGPPYSVYIDDATLYPNPYITISLKGYTKHFYIEQERISTVLGEGGWSNAVVYKDSHDESVCNAFPLHWEDIPCEKYESPSNEDIVGNTPKQLQYDCNPECIESIYLENLKSDFFLNCISSYQQASGHKETIYFTHDDHLSSASWITDFHGEPVQYLHYAPYGELLANQQATGSTYDERYKFTGKERDAETGYDYFGARFLAQQLGIWLSVDPLVDNYLGISPYAYCAWNPIKFVDPKGARPLPMESTFNGWKARVDSWFGPRNTGQKGASTYHKGLDFNYSCGGDRDYGTPILATHEGFAHIVDNIDGKAGRYIEITSEDGTVRTRYLHLSAISITEGQYVLESEKIGEMGGSASGKEHRWLSHLHYEIQKKIDGKWTSIDPVEGKDKNINNILDPQSIIDVDDNLYWGGQLQEIVVIKPLE